MFLRVIGAFVIAFVAAIATLATGSDLTGLGSGDRILGGRLLHENGDVQVYTAPTPNWTRDFELDMLDLEAAPELGGVRYLLDDRQATVAGPEPITFRRIAGQALNQFAVSELSVISLQIVNDFERIYVHEATIVRGDTVIERVDDLIVSAGAAPSVDGQSMQLSEVRSIVIRVPGLRPEDKLVFSYSLAGGHPLVNHGQAAFADPIGAPFAHVRRTIRAPENAEVAGIGAFSNPDFSVSNGVAEHVFADGPGQPSRDFSDAPPWRVGDWAMVSTTPDWVTISQWGADLYQPVVSESVQSVASEIAAQYSDPEDQIAAALGFVQREVRYFAVIFGAGGYDPVLPDETLRLGEGECKAKSLLLMSILTALGFDADVAFVNSAVGPVLPELPPSEAVFDHVIVTVVNDGQRYWLEPSTFEQAGTLATLAQPDYGYALIADGNSTLAPMSVAFERPTLEVNTELQIASNTAGQIHRMTVEVALMGPAADQARTMEELAGRAQLLQYMRQVAGGGVRGYRAVADPTVRDDPIANRISATFNWEVQLIEGARFGDNQSIAFFPIHGAMPPFDAPAEKRFMPLALPYPHVAQHDVRITVPKGVFGEGGWSEIPARDVELENEAFHLILQVRPGEDSVEAGARLTVRSREVSPDQFDTVRADTAAAIEALTLVMADRTDPEIAASLERLFGREPADSPRT